MRARLFVILLAAVMVATGCSQEEAMKPKDADTLKNNLNSPVDVEKVRAEYAKEKGATTGAPTDKM